MTAKTPPAAWDRRALQVARRIASIDRSKLPGLTTQYVAILQEAILESMKMAAETKTPEAAAMAAHGQTNAPVEHGTADRPEPGKLEAALADVRDIRGAIAEFRAQRRDTYPHEAVAMLLDAFEQLADIVGRLLPACSKSQTGDGRVSEGGGESRPVSPQMHAQQRPDVAANRRGECRGRPLLRYGECRCILSQYCDGMCNPIFGDLQ